MCRTKRKSIKTEETTDSRQMASVISVLEDKIKVSKESINALCKAKEAEAALLEKNYKWICVGKNAKILVPCDKKGNPTEAGERRIAKLAENLHIIT